MEHCDMCDDLDPGKKCNDCTELEFGAYALAAALKRNKEKLNA